MKYKWINGPCWDDGISRQNFPYRLSRQYNHDILIDVTNKHELFSLWVGAGNGVSFCMFPVGENEWPWFWTLPPKLWILDSTGYCRVRRRVTKKKKRESNQL